MKRRIHTALVLSIALILAVSGCSGLGDIFGGDVVNVKKTVVENGEKDIIVVKDVQTIPRSPLLPGQQVILSFIVENRDNLESASARTDIFNAPAMTNSNDVLCNLYTGSDSQCPAGETCKSIGSCRSGSTLPCDLGGSFGAGVCCDEFTTSTGSGSPQARSCVPDRCGLEGCLVLPGEEKLITYTLKTPDENDIKSIKTDLRLDFRTLYTFQGKLGYIVPAINLNEIVKRQRAGEDVDVVESKSYGPGPIQIDAQMQGAPYILSNVEGVANPESVITFTIKNRGTGNIVNSKIRGGALTVTFPPELDVVKNRVINGQSVENEKFWCIGGTGSSTVCRTQPTENGDIPLYRDESRSSIRFTVKLRNILNEPFRSYPITATVDYDYELRSNVDITVNPFQNV